MMKIDFNDMMKGRCGSATGRPYVFMGVEKPGMTVGEIMERV